MTALRRTTRAEPNLFRSRFFVGILLASGIVAQPWPASIQIVTAKSVTDSSDWKQVVVNCPAGTIAYHGGASVPATSDLPVVIEQSLPVGGNPPTQWLALAQEVEPTGEPWAVSALVQCAEVPGYELVTVQTDLNSNGFKNLTAPCPPGKSVIGGGGGVFFFSQDLGLTRSIAAEGGWEIAGQEIRPTGASWLASAFASCAPISNLYHIAAGVTADDPDDGLILQCGIDDRLVAGGASLALAWSGAALQQLDAGADYAVGAVVDFLPPYSAKIIISNLCWGGSIFADSFESGDASFW